MEKTKRQSNFELLRIFAMVMIVLFHIQKNGPQRLLTGDYGYFPQPILYLRFLILEIGAPFGPIGNGLFIIISGYFLNSNLNIDTGKIAKKLLLQLGFAVSVLMILSAVWITFFNNEELTLGIVTKGDFNAGWWFLGYYMFVIIIAKVFINRFTAKLTRSQTLSLMLTLLAVSQFEWSGKLLANLATGLRLVTVGVFLFLMGGYIAKYNPFKNVKTFTVILIIAAAVGITFLSQYNSAAESIDYYIKSKSAGPFIHGIQEFSDYEIIPIIIVISIFELFRRMNIPYNAVINFIGKSTLMIYFFHENGFFQMFYKEDAWMEALKSSCLQYCLMWFKWAAIAFAFGLAGYVLYTLLGKLLPRMRSVFITQEPSE